jgi:hypothetical protein
MKKTALASAIALATLASGPVWAETTTIGGNFIFDRTEVEAGGKVNIALLGLNAQGEVDTQGDASGSTIMAMVKTGIGEISGGSDTRGSPLPGFFASSTKFIKLSKGLGRVVIWYPHETKGEDTVEVTLLEQYKTASGATDYRNIANAEEKVTIAPVSTEPEGLAVASFTPSDSDSHGKADECSLWNKEYPCGLYGHMTAGQSGGKILVMAKNEYGIGTVKVTLTYKGHHHSDEEPPTHSYTANMAKGEATITLDGQVTKAGEYFVEATVDGLEGNSVGLVYPDILKVWSTGDPKKLKLWADKERIANPNFSQTITNDQIKQGTHIMGSLLDAYGNMTTNCVPEKNEDTGAFACTAGGEIIFSITDTNDPDVVNGAKLNLHIPAGAQEGKTVAKSGDAILGNESGEIVKRDVNNALTATLVASAKDSAGNAISTIANSDTLAIKVVERSLAATALFSTDQRAGNEFDAFNVVVIGNVGQFVRKAGEVEVKNTKTMEKYVNAPDTDNNVLVSFEKQTWGHKEYLISDQAGSYAQVKVDAAGIKPAKIDKVEFQNAHGQAVTDVAPAEITPDKKYMTRIPEASLKLFDEHGNMKTGEQPLTATITGTFTASTSNAESTSYITSNGGGVPGRFELVDGKPSHVKVTYAATGSKPFAGQDTINLEFTEAPLFPFSLTTTIPAYSGLKGIKSHLSAIDDTIPVNSEVAMTVEVLDGDGKRFVDPDSEAKTTVTVTIGGQEGDNIEMTVTEIWWERMKPSEADCVAAGGTFTEGECVLTEEQCESLGGVWMKDKCMTQMDRQVGNGDTLDFAETWGRKVFVVSAGSDKGQSSITFTSTDDNTITESRTLKVSKTEPPKCEPGSTDEKLMCNYADQCEAAMGIFTDGACKATVSLGATNTFNPSYPATDKEADFGGGFFKVTEADSPYEQVKDIELGETIRLACVIKADEEDIGKSADNFVLAFHLNLAYGPPRYYKWYKVCDPTYACCESRFTEWPMGLDGYPIESALCPFAFKDSLPEHDTLRIYGGRIPYPGEIWVYCGYRLTSGNDAGKIVYSKYPIMIVIDEVVANRDNFIPPAAAE